MKIKLKKYQLMSFLLSLSLGFLSGILFFNFRNPLSPSILYLTQPIIMFSGYVDKINGHIVTVSQTRDALQYAPAGYKPADNLPSRTKTLTYRVIVTNKTVINRPTTIIPLFFAAVTPTPPPEPSVKDIKIGDYISAQTNVDLRTLKSDQFEATSIDLPQIQKSVTGVITKLTKNTIYLKQTDSFTPPPIGIPRQSDSTLKDYAVTLTPETEISGWNIPGQKAEKYTLSYLKQNMNVTVYSAEDAATTTDLTALRIEPLSPPPAPLPGIPSSPQGTPSATSSAPIIPPASTQNATIQPPHQ